MNSKRKNQQGIDASSGTCQFTTQIDRFIYIFIYLHYIICSHVRTTNYVSVDMLQPFSFYLSHGNLLPEPSKLHVYNCSYILHIQLSLLAKNGIQVHACEAHCEMKNSTIKRNLCVCCSGKTDSIRRREKLQK